MKAYLAAPYGARGHARILAEQLRTVGCEITSSWLDETHEITPGTEGAAADLSDEEVRAHALNDFADIRKSDLFILVTAGMCGVEGGGGRHVETGYALARSLPVIVVGQPENVFHRITEQVILCPTWADTIDWVRSLVALEGERPGAIASAFGRDFDCCTTGTHAAEADL